MLSRFFVVNVAIVSRSIDNPFPLAAVNIAVSTAVCPHLAACRPSGGTMRGLTLCNVMRTVIRP